MIKENYPNAYFYRRIVQAKLYIDQNYADNIDVSNIADEAFYSRFHFIRQFKKIYGVTPYQYLTKVRIEKAQQLLCAKVSVSNTCFLIGYDSITSFSGLFKRIVGVTPSTYLLQQQAKQERIHQRPLQYVPGCFAEKHGWKEKSNFQEVIV